MELERLHLRHCAPEELAGVIADTEMEQHFLPGGILDVRIERLYLGSAVVQRGRYGMGILARGAWPTGLVCLGFVLETPSHATVNGYLCPTMSVQLYGEGAEVEYRAPSGSTWFAYCVEREHLQRKASSLCGRPFVIPHSGATSTTPSPASKQRMATTVNALFAAADPEVKPDSPQIRALENRLLYEAACALIPENRRSKAAALRHAVKRQRLMYRAEDYLRANVREPFVLGDCAEAVGCSERMLERHFRAIYGTPPGTWFRCMKLDAARQDLRTAAKGDVHISEIATKWGFLHLGRFSVDYRRLFGEKPSETLRRMGAVNAGN